MNDDYPFEFDDKSVKNYKYKGFITTSHYIKVRDGVKIAIDLSLPKKLPPNEKISTVIIQTRYWRAKVFKRPFKWLIGEAEHPKIVKTCTKLGFAVVGVDTRGSGASHGTRPYPYSVEEVKDGADIVNWIISQPWSDGNVVTCGNSYKGGTSELAVTLAHPAIKCAQIKHTPGWDLYAHTAYPGGVFNLKFMQLWSNLGRQLDQTTGKALLEMKPYNPTFAKIAAAIVRGVKPVDTGNEEDNLENIAKIHLVNKHPYDYFEVAKYRDDPMDDEGMIMDNISPFTMKDKFHKLKIPLYTIGSWWDSTTADVTILRFLHLDNPHKAVITDFDHKSIHRASPYFSHKAKAHPNEELQVKDWVKFFKDCIDNKFENKKELYYFTMGEEKWKKTTTWPPENQVKVPWYFNDNNLLSETKPNTETGADDYKVDFTSGTGLRNRWFTLLSLPINYSNREEEDKKLLLYRSKPLEEDMEITGYPIITLHLKTTHDDGMVHVHMEFLDEEDKVHWITDGQFRFMHRKISTDAPPYKILVPYHSFLKKDALPVVPGELMEVKFALHPTSILLHKGARLQVAIGGADKDAFKRYPAEGNPKLTIERNKIQASCIELPIIRKK